MLTLQLDECEQSLEHILDKSKILVSSLKNQAKVKIALNKETSRRE
jgi:hypothetical protein